MSLSAGNELKTATAAVTAAAGSENSVQIDAQEDREIVGYSLTPLGLDAGNDVDCQASMYVGTDPDMAADDIEDLGGKFFVEHEYLLDSTNGLATEGSIDSSFVPDDEVGWDWNEDVTLTVEVTEDGGVNGGGVRAQVFYREV